MVGLSLRARLLLPLSVLLLVFGHHQLIRLQAGRAFHPGPHEAEEPQILEPLNGDPISVEEQISEDSAGIPEDLSAGQDEAHQEREPSSDHHAQEQEHGHLDLDLQPPDASQHLGYQPPEVDGQHGTQTLLWIKNICHQIGKAVLHVLRRVLQLGKHPSGDQHSEVKGDWTAAVPPHQPNQTCEQKGVEETEHPQFAAEGQQQLEQGLQGVQTQLGGIEHGEKHFGVVELEKQGVVEQNQLDSQQGGLEQEQQVQHSQEGGVDAEQMWQHLNEQEGDVEEVQQQQGQQSEDAGQPGAQRHALNARFAAVLSAVHTWLMGEWRSAQLSIASLARTAQSREGRAQLARAVHHQVIGARDASAEALKAGVQHAASTAGTILYAARARMEAWVQAAAGQIQALLMGGGGEEDMSRATGAKVLLLWKRWGPWGSYWAAEEGVLEQQQRAHPLALLVVLTVVGGGGVAMLRVLWLGAHQILLQQYQQGWEAASMEAVAALIEAREQGRAAAAQAEKQAALAAAQHAAQLQQHSAAAMAAAAAAEHAAAAAQRSAAAEVAVLRAEHEAWAGDIQSWHEQELVEVASKHSHQLAELYQLHHAHVADVHAAAASEKESLKKRHSQEVDAQRRQHVRLMKAWLLVRQQQQLVCKHLKQRAEVQVHEQQMREQKLASKLQQVKTQFAARCKDNVVLESQLEQLQLGLEEAQLELAARGQQLLDMSAVIKSKDDLIAQHKAIMDELQQRLQDLDEAMRSSESRVVSLETDLQQSQARFEEEQHHNQDLQHQLAALPKYESGLVEAAEQMHALLAKHAALQTALRDSASCVADRDAKIEEQARCAQQDKAAHEQQTQDLQQRLDALSTELTRVVEAKDKELQLRHADNRMLKEELAKVETEMRRQRASQSGNAPHVLKSMSMYVR